MRGGGRGIGAWNTISALCVYQDLFSQNKMEFRFYKEGRVFGWLIKYRNMNCSVWFNQFWLDGSKKNKKS
ncbi:hypothetical protein Hanom_Chr12g01136061 [Helianthus anomalus]